MKKTFISTVVLIGLSSLLICGCKSGFFGKFTVKVVDPETLRPIAGATLKLDDSKYNQTTDAKGTFEYQGIESGSHTLTVKYANPFYETSVVPVYVRMDSTGDVLIMPDIKSDAIHESAKDTLKLSCLKPGYALFRGGFGYGVGERTPANNIVLVYNRVRKLVLRPSYLKSYVVIKDSVMALEFVRFFTQPSTFYLLRDPDSDNIYVEVTPTTNRKPSYGEMPSEQYKKLGLTEPIVTNDANSFYITRYVVSKSRKLFKIRETIGFDGDYSVKKTLILTHMEIPLPQLPG